MAKGMKICALVSVVLTAVFLCLHRACLVDIAFAITFGTFSYHFCMRLLVGWIYDRVLHNRVDYNRKWFRVGETEKKLYQHLRVKTWKGSMLTYDPSVFDPKLHSWDEIAQATCQSELVHETNALLSFLPVLASIWFGTFYVFLFTSLLAACYDLLFVILQRYNRPRILKLIKGKTGIKISHDHAAN